MDSLVRALFNECAPEGVRADLVIADALPEIQADRMKIVQVVRNLLCNAFKCRDEGKDGIVITAGYSRTPQDHVFMITDNGIGMSASTLKKIFLLGYSERRSGSEIGGFGLSICAKIVEAHGGQLRATSPGVGKGSTFTFTIPLKDHSA
jgi:signal transduction histidine kinase